MELCHSAVTVLCLTQLPSCDSGEAALTAVGRGCGRPWANWCKTDLLSVSYELVPDVDTDLSSLTKCHKTSLQL